MRRWRGRAQANGARPCCLLCPAGSLLLTIKGVAVRVLGLLLFLVLAVVQPAAAQDEADLRLADAAQHQAARTRDADALDDMMHPAFHVNSPEGEIWSRDRTLELWRNRGIGHDRFDRIAEVVSLDGDVGVVAGREVVQPSSDSIAGQRRADGGLPVERRFTNVWLWKEGRWWFFARHANEKVAGGPAGPPARQVPGQTDPVR